MTNQENSLNSQQLPVVIDSQIPTVDRRKLLQALSAIPFIANADAFVNQLYAQSPSSTGLADSEDFDLELIFDPSINAYTHAPTTTTDELFYSSMYARKEVNDNWTLSHISGFITQKYNPIRKHIVCAAMYRALLEKPAISGHDIEKILSNKASFDAAAAAIDKDKKVNRLDWFQYWTRRYSTVPEDMVKLYKKKPNIPYTRQALTNALKSAQNKTEDQLSDLHMHKQAKFNQIEAFLGLTLHPSEVSAWKNKANRGIAERRRLWCFFTCSKAEYDGLEQDTGKNREKYLRINKNIIRKPIEREPLVDLRTYWNSFWYREPIYATENKIKNGHSVPKTEAVPRKLAIESIENGKKVINTINITESTRYNLTDINKASIDYFIEREFANKKSYINGTNKTLLEDQVKALKEMTTTATEITGDPYTAYLIASRVLQAASQAVVGLTRLSIYNKVIDITQYQEDLKQLIEQATSLSSKSQVTEAKILSVTTFLIGTTLGGLLNGYFRIQAAEEKLKNDKKASAIALQKHVDEQVKLQWGVTTSISSLLALTFLTGSINGYNAFYSRVKYLVPASFALNDFLGGTSDLHSVLSTCKRDKNGKPIFTNQNYSTLGAATFRYYSTFTGLLSYLNLGQACKFTVNGKSIEPALLSGIGAFLSAGAYMVGVIFYRS